MQSFELGQVWLQVGTRLQQLAEGLTVQEKNLQAEIATQVCQCEEPISRNVDARNVSKLHICR